MTDAKEKISMICNFDETEILFVCFGIMEPLAAARQQQGTAPRHIFELESQD
jgi:hypothetical protein